MICHVVKKALDAIIDCTLIHPPDGRSAPRRAAQKIEDGSSRSKSFKYIRQQAQW